MIALKKTVGLILYVGVFTFLTGCALRSARIAATPAGSANNDYLDIQAGWRLTAVTPVLKSGGYVLKTTDKPTSGNGFTLSAGTDFVGYEVAHYDVKGQRQGACASNSIQPKLPKTDKRSLSRSRLHRFSKWLGRPIISG